MKLSTKIFTALSIVALAGCFPKQNCSNAPGEVNLNRSDPSGLIGECFESAEGGTLAKVSGIYLDHSVITVSYEETSIPYLVLVWDKANMRHDWFLNDYPKLIDCKLFNQTQKIANTLIELKSRVDKLEKALE